MLSSLAILGSTSSWHVAEILKECSHQSISVSVVDWTTLGASADDRGERFWPKLLHQADAVLVRNMPSGTLEQVISRMDILARISATGKVVLNHPKSLEAAVDKYLTMTRLLDAGIPVPQTAIVQSHTDLQSVTEEYGGNVVLKPIFGSNGQGLVRFQNTTTQLPPFFLKTGVCVAQKYIANEGWDIRILVIGPAAYAMKRIAAAGEWRTNISQGGRAEPFTPPAEWVLLARSAAQALGVDIAGVDLMLGNDGSIWVLEVNAIPGWRALQTVTCKNISAAVLNSMRQHFEKETDSAAVD
jgi:ribosomal protein S6--L-glutamate ligase